MSSSKTNRFIVMWGWYGLQSIHDLAEVAATLAEWEKTNLWHRLKNEKLNPRPRVLDLERIVRHAKQNRDLEIYEFKTHMSKIQIRQQFDQDIKKMASIIRSVGIAIYRPDAAYEND